MECNQSKVESKKSTKSEHEKCLSKEFVRALSLLYSPEAKSAEELRLMLEIEIVKQKRPKRSRLRTHQKRPKRRKTNAEVVENESSASEKSSQEKIDISGKEVDTNGHVDHTVEEIANRDDIPRISIPDEDQNDGAVCKVCNVPEFGPLTLTQCDTCGKYYHPLCHQPPIVDVCFQESHLLWHCRECRKNDQS